MPFVYYRCSKWSLDSTISKRSLSRLLWFNTKHSCRSCHVWYPGGRRPIGQPCGRRRRRLFGSSWRAKSLEPSCHNSMASTSSAGKKKWKILKKGLSFNSNLLERWRLCQIFVFWVRDFKLWLLAFFLFPLTVQSFSKIGKGTLIKCLISIFSNLAETLHISANFKNKQVAKVWSL